MVPATSWARPIVVLGWGMGMQVGEEFRGWCAELRRRSAMVSVVGGGERENEAVF